MEKFKQKAKKLFTEKNYLPNRVYYGVLFGIPLLGVIVKNVLLQAYLLGNNLYQPDFLEAIKSTWKYWHMYVAIVMIFLSISVCFSHLSSQIN